MRRFVSLILALSTVAGLAHSQTTSNSTAGSDKPANHLNFNGPWIDPTKWVAGGPACAQGLTLECVREVQQGRLRLAIRNMGATGSDSGFQYGSSELLFINPNSITSITADLTVSRANVVGCSTNLDTSTRAVTKIEASFFNTGSGDPADDVTDDLYLQVDPSNPKMMHVANWMTGAGLGVNTDIGTYPIGTILTATNAWDKANHQFVSVVEVKGRPETKIRITAPYPVSDSASPSYAYKGFTVMAYSPNCTSAQTFAGAESHFENVLVNTLP